MSIKEQKALYVHIPFCKKKCDYCDFPSYSGKEGLMLEYTKALCNELKKYKDFVFKTIFIGGGTPTYLSYECILLLKEAFKELKIAENAEFTVEGNPGTFTIEKLKEFKNMGVNRISIGLQAFQNELLKDIGRIHSEEEFLESFKMAKEVGLNNINVDLMFGLPGQSMDQWKESLEKAVELGVTHISCYSLIVEEGTPFHRRAQKGLLDTPSEEIEREMYEYTKKFLEKVGYNQYEISNFAKEGMECRHNLVYWNLEDYIGCGSGAHSFIDGERIENTSNPEEYIELVKINGTGKVDSFENSEEDTIEEFMFMGLRKVEGINKVNFENRFKKDIYSIYGDVIKKHLKNKLIEDDGENIKLTPQGIQLSNMVMSDFMLEKA
ncbi:radical SAM family heme chaperone HemW [Oceanirhabdus sp. W0125-5]|uniref:radical SAM family heme chaperone HemW n=1 Tax=Oceanirhabdus sp. W0125-5 TaxID=2999116 RepID=UPI0022F2D59A|nr:radical SAM family heme chaperone HemW [Oceanirhabdus sp. W0125-5]WBW95786.1 radical SAM family heme chaperone HemW [Oceanirhabdus sp. W0125-5]